MPGTSPGYLASLATVAPPPITGVYTGDVAILDTLSYDRFAAVTKIVGNLYVSSPLQAATFAHLTEVTGDVFLFCPGTVAMPALTTVGGGLVVTIGEFVAALLATVGGAFVVEDAAFDSSHVVSFANLVSVGSFSLDNSDSVTTLNLPALVACGDLTVRDCLLLTTATILGGAFTGDIDVRGCAVLNTLSMPSLTAANNLLFGGPVMDELPVLVNLDLTALATVAGDCTLTGMVGLLVLDLSALTAVAGDFWVYDNTALTDIDLDLLASVGGNFTVDGQTAFGVGSLGVPVCLPSLVSVGLLNAGSVVVTDNTGLTNVVATTIVAPGSVLVVGGWVGASTIAGNG